MIKKNSAVYGGGIYCYESSSMHIYNTTLVENDAVTYGGAIRCNFSEAFFINCTAFNNTSNNGSGLACGIVPAPIVTNCIFWDDSANEIHVYSGEPIITFSDIAGGWEGEGNIDADPLFVDPENGDFHLTVDSPCIDTGTLEGSPEFDFEGDPRPQGDGVDMGADEYSDAVTRVFIQKQQIPVLNVHSREIQPKNKW
ncbi:hypothetical protein H8E77_18970, partial [bacterium]|nr:hypothetical protein [bacterium]